MAVENALLNRFNYGLVSRLSLARTDLSRLTLGAEVQTNILGLSLGAGRLRSGWEHLDSTLNDAKAKNIPFVYSIEDTAILEITDSVMRIRVDDDILTRPSVSTAISNGTFATDLTGWTDNDEVGGSSSQSGGYMLLQGDGTNAAIRTQQVSVAGADQGVEHGLRITISRGPVTIRVGSTDGGDDYISEVELAPDAQQSDSVYSFAFTPTGDFYVQLSNRRDFATSLVETVEIDSSGDFTLPVPYALADLPYIRYDQSGDVIYVACYGCPQKKILRYGTKSWGISNYSPKDGPFGLINTGPIKLQSSGLTGEVTLTSTAPYFKEAMEGQLFKLTSNGQKVEASVSANDQYSDPIEITGVGATRTSELIITGTWAGTLTLQKSVAEPDTWVDTGTVYTTNGTYTVTDTDDNAINYYRVGFNTGYTSGTADISFSTGIGSITGVCRALDYTSDTAMVCSVLSPLGGTDATDNWFAGDWSAYKGYPSAVAFHGGRLGWAGKDKLWLSASDAYESFDEQEEGDAASINYQLGSGPIDRIQWLLSTFRLGVGAQTSERSVRSTSLDEPVTPTNISVKEDSTRGSSPVQAIKVDQNGFFVRNDKFFQISATTNGVDSTANAQDLSTLVPEIGESGFIHLAVQRWPDTRIHALRNDGKVAMFVFDELEELRSWQLIETDGVIEDIVVLPAEEAATEDKVYYTVNRTINGATKRFIEKWAFEEDCVGGTVNKMADSFKSVTVSGATVSGLGHLEGESVVVWANGKDYSVGYGDSQATYTVASGSITLPDSDADGTTAIVGLPYTGQYKSVKLAYGVGKSSVGSPLTQRKRVNYLGLILDKTHNRGLQYGPDFDTLDDMPLIESGAAVDADQIWDQYDQDAVEFGGDWNTDSRLCLQMQAPRPCTVVGVVVGIKTNDQI